VFFPREAAHAYENMVTERRVLVAGEKPGKLERSMLRYINLMGPA
jgi:hypothetical protein